jgi:3-oxoacyl-[acyl-carrier-protein] synthase II
MRDRRVVITGLGMVCPLGNDVSSSWHNAVAGISGVATITQFDTTNFATKIAAEVKNFSPTDYINPKDCRRMDRFIQLGMVAGMQAVQDAQLERVQLDKTRVGLIIGSGIGGLPTIESTGLAIAQDGSRKTSPFFIPGAVSNMIAGQLSILYGYQGMSYGIVSACASANHCLGDALRQIQYGSADIILAGGAESVICATGIAGFNALRVLSTRNDSPATASRPFDNQRDGFVMGEGAAILVLEEHQHALRRGAHIYAEIVGYGATSDAGHITAPNISGPSRSMRLALDDAGIVPSDVGYINAHGTATILGDINETNAIIEVFAAASHTVAISSTKSMTGHLLGAAGAVEAVFSIKALEDNIIPPTINLDTADKACPLDFTPNHAKHKILHYAMSNGFGFGGTNATIIFRKHPND